MSKPAQVIVLPKEEQVLVTLGAAEKLDLLAEKVAERLIGEDGYLFESWFRQKKIAAAIKRIQSVPEQKKFAIFYDRYGCLSCRAKSTAHAGNMLCVRCRARVHYQLAKIVSEGAANSAVVPAHTSSSLADFQ